MDSILLRTLDAVEVGAPASFRNLTLFPLTGPGLDDPGYLTLDEAMEQGVVEIAEVSKAGSVPELEVSNTGALAVLLLDGEELVGARQNRVLNLTVLVPPGKITIIPVSCVEAGRWSFRSEKFAAAPRAHFAAGRARRVAQVTESLRATGDRRSDQGAVWDDIAGKAARLGVQSDTSAMADIYETAHDAIEEHVDALAASAKGHVGAAFGVGGRLAGLELFDSPRTLDALLPKLVRSYALDAIEVRAAKPSRPSPARVTSFLESLRKAQAEPFPAVGEGDDVRVTGPGVSGAALVARGRVVHLSAFLMPGGSLRPSGRVRRGPPFPME